MRVEVMNMRAPVSKDEAEGYEIEVKTKATEREMGMFCLARRLLSLPLPFLPTLSIYAEGPRTPQPPLKSQADPHTLKPGQPLCTQRFILLLNLNFSSLKIFRARLRRRPSFSPEFGAAPHPRC